MARYPLHLCFSSNIVYHIHHISIHFHRRINSHCQHSACDRHCHILKKISPRIQYSAHNIALLPILKRNNIQSRPATTRDTHRRHIRRLRSPRQVNSNANANTCRHLQILKQPVIKLLSQTFAGPTSSVRSGTPLFTSLVSTDRIDLDDIGSASPRVQSPQRAGRKGAQIHRHVEHWTSWP